MSAIADFRLVPVSSLSRLKENAEVKVEKKFFSKRVIDNYHNYLTQNSKKLKEFDGSGYIFSELLIFLEEKGINLLDGEYTDLVTELSEKRSNSTVIFDFQQKEKCLKDLINTEFSIEELTRFNKGFSGNADINLAKLDLEGIKTLQENLELLPDNNHVVLLSIG